MPCIVTCFTRHARDVTIAFSSWVIPVQPWGFAAITSAFEKFGKAWTVYKRRLDGDAAELQARVLEQRREEEAAAAAAGIDVCGWGVGAAVWLIGHRKSPDEIERKTRIISRVM